MFTRKFQILEIYFVALDALKHRTGTLYPRIAAVSLLHYVTNNKIAK